MLNLRMKEQVFDRNTLERQNFGSFLYLLRKNVSVDNTFTKQKGSLQLKSSESIHSFNYSTTISPKEQIHLNISAPL